MFPRGPRFPATKVPDVPGPNAYNTQEPEFDAYKRGAFLEKTNRFTKDNPSDVPGPGAYNTESNAARTKTSTNHTKSSGDRYAILQRKVEELERVHAEGKKAHHLEMERMKLELSRAQRSASEHSERADKLKKQNELLDARVQELKKSSSAEQGELRDLRVKLKMADHERAQLSAKQGEAGEAKKALQAAEAKRRDDLRERDKRIAELEKGLSSERKKRETAEARLADLKNRVDGEAQEARDMVSDLETQLQATRTEAHDSQVALRELKSRAADKQEELLDKLEQHRATLARVAEEYGRLASTTVSKTMHSHAEDKVNALQLRVFRLERKLANADGQVIELANLVRHTKEENTFLAARLREVDAEALFYSQSLREHTNQEQTDPSVWRAFDKDLDNIGSNLQDSNAVAQKETEADLRSWADLYRLRSEALLFHSSVLLKALDDAEGQARQHASCLSDIEAKYGDLSIAIEKLRTDYTSTKQQLADSMVAFETCKAKEASLNQELEKTRTDAQLEVSKVQQMLQKEKEAGRRLAEIVHKTRIAEEALQAEIDQLSSDLSHAMRYEEAYTSLMDEVDALVARNALAEEEAAHLSKFNAEILGHNNPAQRIMYVDKIRRELHETKQKLLICSRDRDTIQADNEDLQHELALYKSVAVPPEFKPRTMVTRVDRAPLSTQSMNGNGNSQATESTRGASAAHTAPKKLDPLPEVEYVQGEMTLDEIL